MHTVIKNLKLFFHELLCTFLYKIERNWQRDVEKFTVNTKANFFTVSMCRLFIQYHTARKKRNTSTMCSCVDVCVLIGWC